VNLNLSSHIRRVEELGTGAAYCQLLDILFPGQVPISRVKFDPKQESDCLDNFKIICSTFTKLSIDKSVDVDRLVSLKFQDNLIFLHWFKKFFDKESKGRGSGFEKILSQRKIEILLVCCPAQKQKLLNACF